MSTSACTPSGIWSSVIPYIGPPVAAGIAIVPVFYGFIAKSAQQLGEPIPVMTVKEIAKRSLKAGPTIAWIVGTQMVLQSLSEKTIKKTHCSDFTAMIMSTVFIGALSAPGYAILTGQTIRRTALESLQSLSFRQTGVIVCREGSFLLSLRITSPVNDYLKETFGDNNMVKFSTAFGVGAIGSVVGHPADTAFTLWQKGRKVHSFRQLMQGGPVKALALGGFSVLYKATTDLLESFA